MFEEFPSMDNDKSANEQAAQNDHEIPPTDSDSGGYLGSPTEYADAEEFPEWFGNLVKMLTAGPVLIGFLCGGLPIILSACFCIATLFI